MKTKEKKTMEYEDAPSGYVTLYNYKEPFMKYRGGTGFLGVLLFDGESDKVQCHMCGKWFEALGNHLHKEHNMTASAYKTEIGLNQSTALIGEKLRSKLIANGMENRLKNLRPHKKHTQEAKDKIRETLKKNSMEMQNLHGTCPEQIIDRLQKKFVELGRTPTTYEIGRGGFYKTICSVYGSYKEALQVAGIPYREPGVTVRKSKYTETACVEFVRNFFKENQRFPKAKEMPEAMRQAINKYGKKEILKMATCLEEFNYEALKKGRFRFTEEQLLNFLRNFEKINYRRPSASDTRRRLLPSVGVYAYNFGSWKEALNKAFK